MASEREKISCVIITHNEEERIAKTLESAAWCDEIIVVDSGSTDKTIDICRQYGCRVEHRNFNGFGEQKQFAVSLTSNNWILSIDADEVVTTELKEEILTLLSKKNICCQGYWIPITLVFLNQKFNYGTESKNFKPRLFNKIFCNFNSNKVHEHVEMKEPTGKLKGEILHYSYKNLHHYFEKFNIYTSLSAERLQNNSTKKKKNRFIIFICLPFTFLKHYIIRGNILNGFAGFVWSMLSSFYQFVKYVKSREKT